MEEKLAKVKAEVVRMHELLPIMDGDNMYVNYADRICTTLEMYIDSLQKEPVSKEIGDYDHKAVMESLHPELKEDNVSTSIDFEQGLYKNFGQVKDFTLAVKIAKKFYEMGKLSNVESNVKNWKEEPVSEDLNTAAKRYATEGDEISGLYIIDEEVDAFKAGAKWQKENLWKPADGDDLPILDREVIALLDNGKVVFAHRPPEYWDGKNIDTGKVTRYYPKTYDKGGWNLPNVKYWLDVELPKEIEI